ncbi:MAG: type I-U CRISPR-associated helicase/endonuclease Cas3 [Nitrococcus sp.]|nr:type I-U CRISPR-associated helicase/endonuclease Cas3 [Nitrococcus sp.]
MESDRGTARRAPVRIAFVVDRRLVVDDAFTRAQVIERALVAPPGPVTTHVAECLKRFAGDGPPLIARRLRGGIPREGDWARTPSQPTVLCSTVDQVGSRLLFRGYGVTNSMKPVHAGLIGSDCLILLDEAHLAEPFRQTLCWVRVYRGRNWREKNAAAPWGAALLTATPGMKRQNAFQLHDEDKSHPILEKRLKASKSAYLFKVEDGEREASIAEKALHALEAGHFAIGVVVNRVARARAVFQHLTEAIGAEKAECLLLIGPARPADREAIANQLAEIRTGAERKLERPLILVATQCIEAGVDIDLDALIAEAAPLDCLRQRFGRLNRAGRDIVPYAAIIAAKSDLSARADDPVYGKAIKPAWDCLMDAARGKGRDRVVEFGLNDFTVAIRIEAFAGKDDAPILLPAHLDLLSQTSPVPAADPEVGLYLHGKKRQPDSIAVIWRADIDPENSRDEDIRRLLTVAPPRSLEAIELPLWVVRRWLRRDSRAATDLADVATAAPEEDERVRSGSRERMVFRWKGNDERSQWINPAALRPGDAIIVPARHGGVDEFGWNPERGESATDVGRIAAEPFAGRRFAVRVAPGLLGGSVSDETLADALASAASQRWQDLRAALTDLYLPGDVWNDLIALDHANRKGSVTAYVDLYGTDDERPRGVVFVAPFGIKDRKQDEDGCANTTEDDNSGSISGFPLSLQQHSHDVEQKAEVFAKAAGLPAERIVDLKIAGFLHDAGKADPRFQAWLYYGDPLGLDPDDKGAILAKSGRSLPPAARAQSGLPEHWRHEALSVRLARRNGRLNEAYDPDLVLWLVGSHHGHGRPFFPHRDPTEQAPDVGPQSLAFDWNGLDWPSLFARLKARYGVWELARMEAILRLADHRASEERAKEGVV